MSAGVLHLIVGPSGVGKDTLLDGARELLATDPRYLFVQRDITRPADAGGEDHRAVAEPEFVRRAAAGGYALCWRAHGLSYGVPVAIDAALDAGQHVVVNVSRSIIDAARTRYPSLQVISVTAPESVLRSRLRDRGREDDGEIEARIQRAQAYQVQGDDVRTVVNDGTTQEGIRALVALLRGGDQDAPKGSDAPQESQ